MIFTSTLTGHDRKCTTLSTTCDTNSVHQPMNSASHNNLQYYDVIILNLPNSRCLYDVTHLRQRNGCGVRICETP